MYYKLQENVCLRGWDRLPWAILIRPKNQVSFIRNEAEFQALELCNGKIDCDGALVLQRLRDIINAAKEQGLEGHH